MMSTRRTIRVRWSEYSSLKQEMQPTSRSGRGSGKCIAAEPRAGRFSAGPHRIPPLRGGGLDMGFRSEARIRRHRDRSCAHTHTSCSPTRHEHLVSPARSLGPALVVGGEALTQLWLFVVAPFAGSLIGATTYLSIRTPSHASPREKPNPPLSHRKMSAPRLWERLEECDSRRHALLLCAWCCSLKPTARGPSRHKRR